MKSFGYLFGQAKGNPDAIRNGMPAVVLHQFGLHKNSGNWCRLKDNTTARHRNEPRREKIGFLHMRKQRRSSASR